MKKTLFALVALLLLAVPIFAQDMDMTPSVTVSDQLSLDGTVTIDQVVSAGAGWIVIHADNGEGAPGAVIGQSLVNPGVNNNVSVAIEPTAATATLFAMLHEDTGEVGVYEFGQVEGADGPVSVDGSVVTPPFTIEFVRAYDQFVGDDGSINIASVTTQQNGFIVVHADSGEGAPGPVIGFAPVTSGQNVDVAVELDSEGLTDIVFPMLHVDTGEAGVYEFGEVEGADGPVVIDGTVATFPITVGTAAMRVPDQIVIGSDATMDMNPNPSVTAEQVLSDGPGWLVVHADGGGQPGAVLGFAPVADGINTNVVVELDSEGVTPILYPMLHVDTGEEGVYEFGEVEGADGPVVINDSVLTFPINAAPSINYEGSLDGNVVTVDSALIDVAGWLVIHADNGEGAPGAVLGYAPLTPGLNSNVSVELDEAGMTETLFPMLHYDTGEAGVYEFGQVEGADGPVIVDGNVIAGPLTPMSTME